jgi:hypothetical protein
MTSFNFILLLMLGSQTRFNLYSCFFIDRNADTNKANVVSTSQSQRQRREDMRLTKMMLLIFCCFLLCFLPLMVFNVIDDEVQKLLLSST